jgi:hypothetical protein
MEGLQGTPPVITAAPGWVTGRLKLTPESAPMREGGLKASPQRERAGVVG